jgi:small GTP-binding protein
LPSLTTLDLDANEISCSGASAIAQYLTGLTTLDLARNQIGDDGAIAIAQHLRALKTLHLGSANIGEAGAKFIAKSLTHLTTLDLGLNNIGENGARAIAQYLVNLKMLYLARNSIGEGGAVAILDSWLVRSETTRLHYLDLRENGDLSALLPAEVLDNPFDPEAILVAYRRAVTSETRALNEAKLLVVGDEAVGKTSLLRYMIHGQPRNPSEDKTLGVAHEKIEIETWAPEAGDVRLNVWDFAGQKKMRGTHRFFLTARSLYLLVLEDRSEDDRSIHDWLRTIKNRGADSPILVVINKSDDGKAMLRLDEQGLRENYPEIVGFLRTSCNDDDFSRKSIQALRERIAGTVAGDERLKHVWDALPKSWLRVKDRITDLAAERAVLPLAEFQTLCAAGDS